MPDPTTTPVALRAQRERTIQTLCDEFAADHIEVEEFERRLDVAHRALTIAELDGLTADLPARAPAPTSVPAPLAHPAPAPATVSRSANQLFVGLMGGAMRRGRWTPAADSTAIAIMGGVNLDFREAVLPAGETVVHAFAFWGGVDIIVPPGLDVAVNGIGIMGGFDHRGDTGTPASPHAARLRVDGLAIMGGVSVRVLEPGAPAEDWGNPLHGQRQLMRQEMKARRHELRAEARRLRDEWRSRH